MAPRRKERSRGIPEEPPPGQSDEDLEARLDALNSRPGGARQWRRRRKRKANRRGGAIMVLVLVALLAGVYVLVSVTFGAEEPAYATIEVEEGETLSEVAEELDEVGIVSSSTLFKIRARVAGEDTGIRPGKYRIERDASADSILATLASEEKDISTYAVTVPEGLTVEETARVIEEQGGVSATEFEKAAASKDYGYRFLEDRAVENTEGFLFPKRYQVENEMDARGLVDMLLQQYLLETEGLDFAGARDRLGLTEYQVVIVASLVEKESANPEERPRIAAVIYNRLEEDMLLQIDATVQYALDEPKERLSLDDLKVKSPYNTYENRGLPPGPIASPSRESIIAALEPAETDDLYYVLKADGKEHFFTRDYEEFLAAKEKAGH